MKKTPYSIKKCIAPTPGVRPLTGRGIEGAAWPTIHQIYYEERQVAHLEKDFIPYNNVANPRSTWCEYFVFRTEYLAGTCGHGLTGFVSWKFGQKTGIRGDAFRRWVAAHPGYDVYFVNPFPELAQRRFRNVWHHASFCHPEILTIAQSLFDKVGYRIDLESLRMDERVTAYCNYWAGTPGFWRRYMEFCEPLHDMIENGLTPTEEARILARADAESDCCYIPYIFERLFSTLLCIENGLRTLRMPLPKEEACKAKDVPWYRKIPREIYRPIKRMKERQSATTRGGSRAA